MTNYKKGVKMKNLNNFTNKKEKNLYKKIVSKLFILALPIIILSPILPVMIIFLPSKISHIFTGVVAIYIGLILLTLTISLFFSDNIATKLMGIPMNYVMVLIGIVVYKLNIYLLLLNAFSLGKPFVLTSEMIDETMDLLMPLMMFGIWISILPLLFYYIRMFFKLTKKKSPTNTIKGQGCITSIVDTHTKINNNRVYRIVLEVESETGKSYVVEKDFIIPNHIIHTITLGDVVDVLIERDNLQDIYIETSYGLL
jgi:hypothetical protein